MFLAPSNFAVLEAAISFFITCKELKIAQLALINLFFGSTPQKIRRVCMEFSEYNWATISETICREMLIFGK